jgi:hypothetical protein
VACDQVIPTQPARAYRPLCAPWFAGRSPWQDRYKSLDDPMCDLIYTLMTDARTWTDAEKACKAAGKQLATVRSAAQNAQLLTAAAGNRVWIGGTDAASESLWVWSPSNTLLSYTNWHPGEPNDWPGSGGEDCLEFNFPNGNGGKWNDASCTGVKKYVCETTCTLLNPPECDRTYSSVYGDQACGTGHARSMLGSPQAWSARVNNAGQWMRIDAGSALLVYGVRTQARASHNQKVTEFTVQHSTDDSAWSNVDGGARFTDASGELDARFFTPVMAQYIRITVVSWASHISMRAGLIRSLLPLQVAQPPSHSESTRPLHAFLTCASPAIGATVRGVRQPTLLRWILPWRRGLQRDGVACRGRTERPCGSSSRKGYRSPPTHGPAARSTTGTSALGVTWASTSRRRTRKGCAQPAPAQRRDA